jgi:hypothetical protein
MSRKFKPFNLGLVKLALLIGRCNPIALLALMAVQGGLKE